MSEALSGMSSSSRRNDPVWERALDWLLRVQAAPGDAELSRQRDLWLAENGDHAKAYRKAEKVWRITGDVAPASPVHGVSAPVGAAPRVRRGVVLSAAAMAACLALVLASGLNQRPGADYHTGTGETRQVVLADGSTVDLDAESAMGVALSSGLRAVTLLSGRAFFQVAADRNRPFVVSVGEMTVTVTGTAFDIRSMDEEIAVEVQSGAVSVVVEHDGRQMTANLEPGGRASVSRRAGTLAVDAVPPIQVGLWRSGRMVVNGATVAQVVEELRRHHRGVILLRDQTLAARRVTGVFDVNDTAAALDAVLQPHGGVVRELTPYVLVVSAR